MMETVGEITEHAVSALRARLRHVYWIGGGSGAGKSTIARRVADGRGLRVYATDDAMPDHDGRFTPHDAPLLSRFKAMEMDERWVNRSPQTMLESFHWFQGELFGLTVEDLLRLPAEPGVIAEGFRLLPRHRDRHHDDRRCPDRAGDRNIRALNHHPPPGRAPGSSSDRRSVDQCRAPGQCATGRNRRSGWGTCDFWDCPQSARKRKLDLPPGWRNCWRTTHGRRPPSQRHGSQGPVILVLQDRSLWAPASPPQDVPENWLGPPVADGATRALAA